jgi:class 3 adenylate cyclase
VYALTGRPPAPGPEIDWEGVSPELAKRLDRVLARALDPDPVRRPPTANDLLGRIVAARDSVLPAGVVTFALTDIEGSTALWEAHPDVMSGVIVRHYELAAEIAEAHGGRMPRSQGEGDSTLTAFARATKPRSRFNRASGRNSGRRASSCACAPASTPAKRRSSTATISAPP